MLRGIANVWVPVEEIDRALDFYHNTLDFPVIKQDVPWAKIDANGLNIGLNGREPQGAQACDGPIITFQPEAGMEAAVRELKGKGVEFPRRYPSTSGSVWRRSRTARATNSSSTNRRAPEPCVRDNVEGIRRREDSMVRRHGEQSVTKKGMSFVHCQPGAVKKVSKVSREVRLG